MVDALRFPFLAVVKKLPNIFILLIIFIIGFNLNYFAEKLKLKRRCLGQKKCCCRVVDVKQMLWIFDILFAWVLLVLKGIYNLRGFKFHTSIDNYVFFNNLCEHRFCFSMSNLLALALYQLILISKPVKRTFLLGCQTEVSW